MLDLRRIFLKIITNTPHAGGFKNVFFCDYKRALFKMTNYFSLPFCGAMFEQLIAVVFTRKRRWEYLPFNTKPLKIRPY